MKTIIRITAILLALLCTPTIAQAEYDKFDCDNASTQLDINLCAEQHYQQVDGELNDIYREIQTTYANNPELLQNLRTAQRLWIEFRETELDARYPLNSDHDNPRVTYGSIYPTCVSIFKESLTILRTQYLRQWIDGHNDGTNLCRGTTPLRLEDDDSLLPQALTEEPCPTENRAEFNQCTHINLQNVDNTLNQIYQQVLAKHADSPALLENLKISQRLWVRLRDADIKATFPDTTSASQPMCSDWLKTKLTQQRITQLRLWLGSMEEGDMCSGSVPITQ